MFIIIKTMPKRTMPANQEAIDAAYQNCEKNKRFRAIDKNSFSDYVVRSQKDIASADNDFKNEDYYWARIKAYQALFHMLNALLVKKLGYFSKDHGCIIAALMKNEVITDEAAQRLHVVVQQDIQSDATATDALQDIDDFRIQRNFVLYKPKAWEDVTKRDVELELRKIRNNLQILAELL